MQSSNLSVAQFFGRTKLKAFPPLTR